MANMSLLNNYQKGYGASFVTLTYDDNHLPIAVKPMEKNGLLIESTLRKEDSQKYMRTMRRHLQRAPIKDREKINTNYSYIIAGEYGEEGLRPHIHIVVIGVDADTWAKYSRTVWTKGTQKIETLKGTSGINYVTAYFSQSVNRKEAERIFNEYGIEPPYISKSRGMADEYITKHLDEIRENGARYTTRGKKIPLPRAIREKLKKVEGIKYSKESNELKQTIAESKKLGFKNAMDYQKWRDWIKNYSAIQRSRAKGNNEGNEYVFTTAQTVKINYLQGENEV